MKARNKKANRYESRDESSYLVEEEDRSFFNQRSSMTRKYDNNKENYSIHMNPQPNEEEMQESFQKINEEEILKKIGRINKLNQEINGRLQKILVKVSSH